MKYSEILKKNYLVFIMFFLFFLFYDNLVFTIPFMLKESNISMRYFGYILAGGTIARSILGGYLSNKGDRVKIRWCLGSISLITLLLLFFSRDIFFMIPFFILVISLATTFNITLNPIISRLNKSESLGLVFGIRDAFLYVGSGIGLAISGYLIEKGISNIIPLNIAIGVLLILGASFIFKRLKKEERVILEEDIQYRYRDVVKERDILSYLLLVGVFTLAGGAISFLPVFGQELDIDRSIIYYVFSGSIFISAFFSLVGGYLIDRCNRRRMYLVYIFSHVMIYISLILGGEHLYYLAIVFYTFNLVIANVLPSYFFENYNGNYWGIVSITSLILGSGIDIFIGWYWEVDRSRIIYLMLTLSILSFLLGIAVLKRKVEVKTEIV